MAEGELMPYDLIVVKDMTEKFEHIIEKHYQDNKEDFDREFAQRRNDELKQTPNKAKVCVDGFDISPTVGIRHVVAYDS